MASFSSMEIKSLLLLFMLYGSIYAKSKRILVSDNDYIESRLRNMETNLEAKILQMNATINKLQAEGKETRENVAFYATLSAHSTLGQSQTIIFDKVITNLGHGYSQISGVFTVPKTGLYHFSSSMLQANTGDIHTQIMRNNVEIGRNYGNAQRASGTINVLTSANKDEQVYVRHMQGVGSQTIHGGGYSSFSGFLIK